MNVQLNLPGTTALLFMICVQKSLRARHIKGCMEDGTYVVDGKEKHASPTTIDKDKISIQLNVGLCARV